MTIHLPDELQRPIRSEVLSGRFATEDDAVAAIVREYFRRHAAGPTAEGAPVEDDLGSIGAMRDDADALDLAVEAAMQAREGRPWRLGPGE